MTKQERLRKMAEVYDEWVLERDQEKPPGGELHVERAANSADERSYVKALVAAGVLEPPLGQRVE